MVIVGVTIIGVVLLRVSAFFYAPNKFPLPLVSCFCTEFVQIRLPKQSRNSPGTVRD